MSPWEPPDDTPEVCSDCGARDLETDDWTQDAAGTYCQDCTRKEVAA